MRLVSSFQLRWVALRILLEENIRIGKNRELLVFAFIHSDLLYRCSKTGLNMAMKSLSVDLKDTGILVVAMHPGWVKTRIGGANALIDTETCVSTISETLQGLTVKDHGAFLQYDNTTIPW